MRSKDLAKASGLAVAFDHTAPTFYRVSRKMSVVEFQFDDMMLNVVEIGKTHVVTKL